MSRQRLAKESGNCTRVSTIDDPLKPSFQALSRLQSRPRAIFELTSCACGVEGERLSRPSSRERVQNAFNDAFTVTQS